MPGAGAPDIWSIAPKPKDPLESFGNPASFTGAARQQGNDYDEIMNNYRNLIQSTRANSGVGPRPVTPTYINAPTLTANLMADLPQDVFSSISSNKIDPQLAKYEESSDVDSALSRLSELEQTGGYTEAGKADIRARSIAPTRSIYSSAQENLKRQRALTGGYSPNFNAAQTQLARDESDQIGDINVKANASIAQAVASNRLAAAPAYAEAAAREEAARNALQQRNADIVNQINAMNEQNRLNAAEFNAQGAQRTNQFNIAGRERVGEFNAGVLNAINQANAANSLESQKFNSSANTGAQQFNTEAMLEANRNRNSTILGGIEGMRNLYGTTPALTNLFGNQVTQAKQLDQNQQQINNQRFRDIYGFGAAAGPYSFRY